MTILSSRDLNQIKEDMWKHQNNTWAGIQVVCEKCGGGSAAFCACAEGRFFDETTELECIDWLKDPNCSKHLVKRFIG
jgi:hypothetical protein